MSHCVSCFFTVRLHTTVCMYCILFVKSIAFCCISIVAINMQACINKSKKIKDAS